VPVSDVSAAVVEDATLRADRGRLVRLFETLFRWSEAGSTADARVGMLAEAEARSVADGGYPGGIYVERTGATPECVEAVTDPEADGPIGPAIAREIAQAHGWKLVAAETRDGTLRFELSEITTLEPAGE